MPLPFIFFLFVLYEILNIVGAFLIILGDQAGNAGG